MPNWSPFSKAYLHCDQITYLLSEIRSAFYTTNDLDYPPVPLSISCATRNAAWTPDCPSYSRRACLFCITSAGYPQPSLSVFLRYRRTRKPKHAFVDRQNGTRSSTKHRHKARPSSKVDHHRHAASHCLAGRRSRLFDGGRPSAAVPEGQSVSE